MPSPFPGMDPYLEHPGRWPDVHHRLISIASDLLVEQLRPKYYVRIEERVYLSDEYDPGRAVLVPDIKITANGNAKLVSSHRPDQGAVATVEPVMATTLIEEEIHEARLEIIDREMRSVVTVIEILSPANKISSSHGEKSYREKRLEVMHSPTHFVEIDLLRAGPRIEIQESIAAHDYLVHVSRAQQRPKGELWPIPLEAALPAINIPVRPEDPEAILDLQIVLNTAYHRAAYDLDIDYRSEPVPTLTPRLAAWADRLLKSKNLR
jgi:hypothetical protein